MTTTDEDLLREAIALADRGADAGAGGPFGAIVARGAEVVGRGFNRVVVDRDPTAHAEVMAIRAACAALDRFSLEGCVVYASCEPCPMCLGAILWSRADRLVHAATRDDAAAIGFDDARLYREFGRPAGERTLPVTALLAEEARDAMRRWAARPDRITY